MVAMDRFESLQIMIQIAVRIDNWQYDKFVKKKTLSKPIPKYKLQFKKNPMELNATKEEKNCYACGKMGHLKRNCPKKTIEISKKWIEIIKEPETTTKINHGNLSWTTCNEDQCGIYRSFKNNVERYPKIKLNKKPSILYKFYPTKTPVTAVMVVKIKKSKIPGLITQNTKNTISTSLANRIKKYLDTEYIRDGKKQCNISQSNQNINFWDQPI